MQDGLLWLTQQEMPQLFFAGTCGGLVRWGITMEPWKQAIRIIGVGALSAAFVGRLAMPLLSDLVNWSGGEPVLFSTMLSGFVIGVGGLAVPTLIIDFFTKRKQLILEGGQSAPPPGNGASP